MALACLREGYPLDIPESPCLNQARAVFLLFSMDIPINILMLVRTLRVMANLRIFPGIFPGIYLEKGATLLERGISMKFSGISLKASGISISQASLHHFPWIFLGISLEIFLC